MTPQEAVAQAHNAFGRLLALPRDVRECEYHGPADHALEDGEATCLFCERARLDSMLDALRDVSGRQRWEQAQAHEPDACCDCAACLRAFGTYKPGHSGGLAF